MGNPCYDVIMSSLSHYRLKRKVQEIKDLKSLMGDINIQLSTNRTKNKKTTKTSLSVKDLLHRLVVTMEEVKNIEKSLDRIHSMEKQDYSIDVDYALRLVCVCVVCLKGNTTGFPALSIAARIE